MALPRDAMEAIHKHAPRVDKLAKRLYGISGDALLAKLVTVESGGDGDAVSSAGARGWTQFMPGTRREVMRKYGIDPWRSADEAVLAATHHLNGDLGHAVGLRGYNPGMPSYEGLVLNTKVGDVGGGRRGGNRGGGGRDGGSAGPRGGSVDVNVSDPGRATVNSGDAGVGLSALLSQITQPRQAPPVSSLPEPAFSARRSLAVPQGSPPPLETSPPPRRQRPSTDDTLDLVRALTGGEGPSVQGPEVPEPSVSITPGAPRGGGRGGARSGGGREDSGGLGGGSGLFELFYDPVGGWDRGKSIGAIGGHKDHIHVAAGPKTIQRIAEEAKRFGLRVGELEPFDKVDPVHTGGSFHYQDRATDLSGPEDKMRAFTNRLRRAHGLE